MHWRGDAGAGAGAAKKYLVRGQMPIVAVGDTKIGELLRQFGAVDVYDANGAPISR